MWSHFSRKNVPACHTFALVIAFLFPSQLLLAAFFAAHLVTLVATDADADADADANNAAAFPGHGRRLVVRKRKRPLGFGPAPTTPQHAFAQLQNQLSYYNTNNGERMQASRGSSVFGPRPKVGLSKWVIKVGHEVIPSGS